MNGNDFFGKRKEVQLWLHRLFPEQKIKPGRNIHIDDAHIYWVALYPMGHYKEMQSLHPYILFYHPALYHCCDKENLDELMRTVHSRDDLVAYAKAMHAIEKALEVK